MTSKMRYHTIIFLVLDLRSTKSLFCCRGREGGVKNPNYGINHFINYIKNNLPKCVGQLRESNVVGGDN